MPSAFNSCRRSCTCWSWAAKLSVTSSCSCSARMPVELRMAATVSIHPGCASWARDRFTASKRGAAPPSFACQATKSSQALASTKSPSAPIRPHSSATGMNSTGETTPRAGCCQRTSASTPAAWSIPPPPIRPTTGWYTTNSWFSCSAVRRSTSMSPRWAARSRIDVSNITWRAPPARLACTMAMLASRRTVSASPLASAPRTMPMLTLQLIVWPSTWYGLPMASSRRSATL